NFNFNQNNLDPNWAAACRHCLDDFRTQPFSDFGTSVGLVSTPSFSTPVFFTFTPLPSATVSPSLTPTSSTTATRTPTPTPVQSGNSLFLNFDDLIQVGYTLADPRPHDGVDLSIGSELDGIGRNSSRGIQFQSKGVPQFGASHWTVGGV